MSTVTKCDICGDGADKVGQLILYEPNFTHGTQKKEMDICQTCRNRYTVSQAFTERKTQLNRRML